MAGQQRFPGSIGFLHRHFLMESRTLILQPLACHHDTCWRRSLGVVGADLSFIHYPEKWLESSRIKKWTESFSTATKLSDLPQAGFT